MMHPSLYTLFPYTTLFRSLVEIGVKDPLVHEISVLPDVKQNPPKIVELKRRKGIRKVSDRLLDGLAISTDGVLSSRFDLRDYGKAVACGRLWIDRSISSLLWREESFLRDCHRTWLRPIALFGR